jgi:tricarballylate dehydrogenase
MNEFDVVVVGKGNAALCAALAARDTGASVAMLEAAPVELSGGNSRFAGGVMRFAYSTVEELQKLADIPEDEAKSTDWDSNSIEEFYEDLYRVTSYRTDPNLSETLIT